MTRNSFTRMGHCEILITLPSCSIVMEWRVLDGYKAFAEISQLKQGRQRIMCLTSLTITELGRGPFGFAAPGRFTFPPELTVRTSSSSSDTSAAAWFQRVNNFCDSQCAEAGSPITCPNARAPPPDVLCRPSMHTGAPCLLAPQAARESEHPLMWSRAWPEQTRADPTRAHWEREKRCEAVAEMSSAIGVTGA